MEKERIAVGLDIGTTKIVAMVGKLNEYGKLEILGHGSAKSLGVRRGVVNNITRTVQSIQEAVQKASTMAEVEIDEIMVGIAGQHIRSLQHSDYIMRENSDEKVIEDSDIDALCEQVYKLVMLPGEEIIHVLPQKFKVDGEAGILEPVGMFGNRLEADFHVVVGQIASIRNVGQCIGQSGLKSSSLTLEPLASAKAVLSEEEMEAGVVLLDIGGGTTDLAIFKDGIIHHTAVIPYGGNIITEDIKEGCSIIEKQAELLKIKFGSAWPGEMKDNEIVAIPGLRGSAPKEITLKNLAKIIHARVSEIIELAFTEIKNYGYLEQKKKLIGGIVITGGGAQLKHLKQLVEYITGMNTRIGYPNEHMAGNSSKEITSPVYATSVGLVMMGIEHQNKKEEEQEELQQQEQELAKTEEVINSTIEEVTTQKEVEEETKAEEEIETKKPKKRPRSGLLDNFFDRFKSFMDSAGTE